VLELHPLAIAIAVVTVFVISSRWYVVFGRPLAHLSPAYAQPGRPPTWKGAHGARPEPGRGLGHGGLATLLDVRGTGEALLLGLSPWAGFPVVLLTGSVIWESVPRQLATIHAGTWLLKLVVISILVVAIGVRLLSEVA
jgi:hypothetical protein